ncbi:MAG: glycoside hydrolase family 25 protein [Lachnospiraceae bacterium]|nr:glycoside hydrolase family 25 protein [Lachnospiraceae bacterium]
MKLPGEDENRPMGASVVNMTIGIFIFMLLLLYVILKINKNDNRGSEYVRNAMQQQQQDTVEEITKDTGLESSSGLRAEDLGFWDMYPEKDEDTDKVETVTSNKESDDKKWLEDFKVEETVQEDPATDGKHTLVKLPDGTEEWVLISPYLKKSAYDFSNLTETAGLKKYTEGGKKISQIGVDISKHNGTVNFERLKSDGIDYVMIRLGARGYSTGQISLDDNFVENMDAAVKAELNIGVYFYSQAINQEEAIQEAYFVIQNLEPYRAHINFPVAFYMENITNDKARIDGLSRSDKTLITATFLEAIKAAGYIPMVYGNKEWLIKNVDLTKLQNYDVWLSQDGDTPDYPYLYTMWQYTTTGNVNGITGDASINICFVNYSDR